MSSQYSTAFVPSNRPQQQQQSASFGQMSSNLPQTFGGQQTNVWGQQQQGSGSSQLSNLPPPIKQSTVGRPLTNIPSIYSGRQQGTGQEWAQARYSADTSLSGQQLQQQQQQQQRLLEQLQEEQRQKQTSPQKFSSQQFKQLSDSLGIQIQDTKNLLSILQSTGIGHVAVNQIVRAIYDIRREQQSSPGNTSPIHSQHNSPIRFQQGSPVQESPSSQQGSPIHSQQSSPMQTSPIRSQQGSLIQGSPSSQQFASSGSPLIRDLPPPISGGGNIPGGLSPVSGSNIQGKLPPIGGPINAPGNVSSVGRSNIQGSLPPSIGGPINTPGKPPSIAGQGSSQSFGAGRRSGPTTTSQWSSIYEIPPEQVERYRQSKRQSGGDLPSSGQNPNLAFAQDYVMRSGQPQQQLFY